MFARQSLWPYLVSCPAPSNAKSWGTGYETRPYQLLHTEQCSLRRQPKKTHNLHPCLLHAICLCCSLSREYLFLLFFLHSCHNGRLKCDIFALLFTTKQCAMSIVLKQPIMPDHKLPAKNTRLKITMAEFSLKYAQTKKRGIGIVSADGESVQIQVFRRSTMLRMKLCVIFSTISFFVSILMILYCASWPYVFVQAQRH